MNWLNIANKYHGTKEIPGKAHNSKIVNMFSKVGFSGVKDDETAWCAAFTGAVLKEAGLPYLKTLTARDYLQYGKKLNKPKEGAIVVFWRGRRDGWQGHVGFVTLWDKDYVWCLGGNQSNKVNVQKFPRSRVLGFRWPETPKKTLTPKEIEKEVVKKSTKLSFLQSIRRVGAFIVGALGSVFSLDSLGVLNNVYNGLSGFLSANAIPIVFGGIIAFWFVLKWVEWKQLGDYKEGRYTPSGMNKEVEDV